MVRRVTLLTLATLALLTAPAWADGDPASDVLLAQDVFLPYAPNLVSEPASKALEETVARAKAKGFAVKVALIADARDLGSAGRLLNSPQEYANLLTSELSLNVVHGRKIAKPRVLTVQPTGLGGNNLGDRAGDALDGVLPAADPSPDELARTAAVAIGKLAAAEGRAIALPALPEVQSGSGGGGGVPAWLLYGLPVLMVAGAVLVVNRRLAAGEAPAEAPDPA